MNYSKSTKSHPLLFFFLFFGYSLLFAQVSGDQDVGKVETISPYDHWEVRNFTVPELTTEVLLTSGTASTIITIHTDSIINPVFPTIFGVNSNFRSGNDLVDRTPLYEEFGSFRYPAGSGSNKYFYDCNIPDEFLIDFSALCGTATWALSPEKFVEFKKNADGEATVVVNYMYARYGLTPEGNRESRVMQAAKYAADFVRLLNVEYGADVKYWEIGNENYGQWEEGYNVNGSVITGKEYGEDFQVFADEMKAVDPDIKVGAVLWHRDESDWNAQVLPKVQNHADFLIVHHYFNVENSASAKASLEEITSDMQEIQTAVANHTNKAYGDFPVAFTEFNIQDSPATTMINGMFVAEALATMIQNGFFMSNIWVNEWRISDNHSKGLLSQEDPDQADYTPRPAYTPFYYYDRYFGDQMVETSVTGNANVRAYASTFSSGEIGMVIVNYEGNSQRVKLDGGFTDGKAYWHSVHAHNVDAGNMRFYVNDQTGVTTGGGPHLDQVAAHEAAFNGDKIFDLKPYSATYLVLQNNSKTGNPSDLPITPDTLVKKLGKGFDVTWSEFNKFMDLYDEKVVQDFSDAGFSNVRIRINDADPDVEFMDNLKQQVDHCLKHGIYPILSYQGHYLEEEAQSDEDASNHLTNWWGNMAEEFKDYSHRLAFNLMVEISGQYKTDYSAMNLIYKEVLTEIRKSNPTRIVIFPPVNISNPDFLQYLEIPGANDPYTMAEWHFYAAGPSTDPSNKKYWAGGETEIEKNNILGPIQTAIDWMQNTGYKTWVGAWMAGNYNKGHEFDIPEQVEFASFMVRALDKVDIPWSVNAGNKFYDYENQKWFTSTDDAAGLPVRDVILDPSRISLYSATYYGGESERLAPGIYDTDYLQTIGFDKQVKSVMVPYEYEVYLYPENGYKGVPVILNMTNPDITMNVRSIRIVDLNDEPEKTYTIEEISISLCEGEHFLFNETSITESGFYIDTVEVALSEYIIYQLTLEVLSNAQRLEVVTLCSGESYVFGGVELNNSGIYIDTLPAANGCYEILTLDLTFIENEYQEISVSICTGESYLFKGESLTQGGIYYDTTMAANGCDLIRVLALTVIENEYIIQEATICDGEVFDFNGRELRESGIYRDTTEAANGCNKIVTLNLIKHDQGEDRIDALICEGESYSFNGMILTEAGIYYDSSYTEYGCLNLVILDLHVGEMAMFYDSVAICSGASYDFFGSNVNVPGIYADTARTSQGCLEIHQLTLEVIPEMKVENVVAICNGVTYDFNGVELSYPGIYIDTLVDDNECPIYDILELSVAEPIVTTINDTICLGDTLDYNGTSIVTSGHYNWILTSADGCDSTVVLIVESMTCSVRTNDPELTGLECYPNPVMNVLTVASSIDEIVELELLDASGRVIHIWRGSDSRIEVDMNALGEGIYLLQVRTKDKVGIKKVVKL